MPERQRIQVALTALGFDTRGTDGAFGARSREMIQAWQKARNQPVTGFLNGTAHQALLREAAPALQKYEEDQKKAEEAKKAEEDAKQKAAAATPAPAPTATTPAPASPAPGTPAGFDGSYTGTVTSAQQINSQLQANIRISGTSGTGSLAARRCGEGRIALAVATGGDVTGTATVFDNNCGTVPGTVQGRLANQQLQLTIAGPGATFRGTLSPGVAAAAPAAPASPTPAPGAAGPLANGPYSGGLDIQNFVVHILIRMTNGTGSGTVTNPRCGELPISLAVDAAGNVTGNLRYTTASGCGAGLDARVTGKVEGNRMLLEVAAVMSNARGRVVLSPGTAGAAPTAAPPAAAAPPPVVAPGTPAGEFDGVYGGALSAGGGVRPVTLRIAGMTATGTYNTPRCGDSPLTLKVSASGEVSGDATLFDTNCGKFPSSARGRVVNKQLQLSFSAAGGNVSGTLTPR